MYSSALTADSPTYSRTGCDMLKYYYEDIQVSVVEAGYYSLGSSSSVNTFDYIYANNFNPSIPSINLISRDDDSLNNTQLKLVIALQPNTTYVLVVTTYYPNVTGKFSVLLSGPNNISLNTISEYTYYL